MPNALTHETSPYLLQHAENPVDWLPWGDAAFERARQEDKLVLVSIGYSACHWCHVMEHESFEDAAVAEVMNEHFINIKVDREERPDVDQLYMNAVQLMTGRGGWPLNVFVLPDGRPVYGGTYFPRQQWVSILEQLHQNYRQDKPRFEEYANRLTEGVVQMSVVEAPRQPAQFPQEVMDACYASIAQRFDRQEGGTEPAPKFPMPTLWQFLLGYYARTGNEEALQQVELTLLKMGRSGTFDQIGGGFARYATDRFWKIPHFEKMLYDNGQLLSLYSAAYTATGNERFREVVRQTVDWLEREMKQMEGGFYAALDADSEGVEGKFYLWQPEEVRQVLGDDADWFIELMGIGKEGRWEGSNILLEAKPREAVAKQHEMTPEELEDRLWRSKEQLLEARESRIRPGLDDKVLTGWNAIMMKGLLDAYLTFGKERYFLLAQENLSFLESSVLKDEQIFRSYKEGSARIPAFLEDYAHFIRALITFYQATFELRYLQQARELTERVLRHFYDEKSGYCWFIEPESSRLVANYMDVSDNVIPASNSVMAENLWLLGRLFDDEKWTGIAQRMVLGQQEAMKDHGSWSANWARLYLLMQEPQVEVAIVGEEAVKRHLELHRHFAPNKLVLGSAHPTDELPLLKGKGEAGKTLVYVCEDKSCQRPVERVQEVVETLRALRD